MIPVENGKRQIELAVQIAKLATRRTVPRGLEFEDMAIELAALVVALDEWCDERQAVMLPCPAVLVPPPMPDPSVGQFGGRCFICGEDMTGVTTRKITVLGTLRVEACAPCVDLPDTTEFVNRLIVERLMPQEVADA